MLSHSLLASFGRRQIAQISTFIILRNLLNFTCFQIENQIGDAEVFANRVSDHLAPCIAQFAVAAGDETCWKTMNHQICLKTRHSSSQVLTVITYHIQTAIILPMFRRCFNYKLSAQKTIILQLLRKLFSRDILIQLIIINL